MHPFSFATTAQLICEPGSAKRLASLCREREARSVLIVTDPGITRLGLLDRVLPGFAAEGVEVAVYDQVLARRNPSSWRRWSRRGRSRRG